MRLFIRFAHLRRVSSTLLWSADLFGRHLHPHLVSVKHKFVGPPIALAPLPALHAALGCLAPPPSCHGRRLGDAVHLEKGKMTSTPSAKTMPRTP